MTGNWARARGHWPAKPTSAPSGHLLPEEGGRKSAVPRIVISSESEKSFSFAVRKSCEECGERETPYFMRFGSTVFHADGFTKENGNGKRKRSLDYARDDETGWHISHCFSIPQRKPPSLSLPPWGRGTASAVDRVLSLMAHLRRSPSSLSYR